MAYVADATTTIESVKEAVRRFAAERQWEPYHSPKNVAMALAVEAGELMEPFRWLECDESRRLTDDARQAVAEELADVAILALNMSLSMEIDLSEAITLGERVILFSRRPGRVTQIYDIPFSHPRDPFELHGTREFADLHASIWRTVSQEFRSGGH